MNSMNNIDKGITFTRSNTKVKNTYMLSLLSETSEGYIRETSFFNELVFTKLLPVIAHIFYNEDDDFSDALYDELRDYIYELIPRIDSPSYSLIITSFVYIDDKGDVYDITIDMPEYKV